ncbi:hypothetical protein VOLCADRAFT_100240 [Volvox carteri f. nagariensis]|uniref:Uncharacterized protein n=1 Tax=Volvox carteri f. nagariensis TaxID=3068 RepID=D8UJS8_VOLCA|nr:uncharacterized protein VOLCADRAFT_100240 [Volvox carteri f. nagariensis]EFJ40045.1 hypothetical protein VOLCADRAFT_100240 [Volvox carteri f. nagariensis]|eukprot:XP_002958914.1 hypothetical protein VOLCADRAFT_100240 [Volvox carteri f. nagariensis]
MGCGASAARVPSVSALDPGELRDQSLPNSVILQEGVAKAGQRDPEAHKRKISKEEGGNQKGRQSAGPELSQSEEQQAPVANPTFEPSTATYPKKPTQEQSAPEPVQEPPELFGSSSSGKVADLLQDPIPAPLSQRQDADCKTQDPEVNLPQCRDLGFESPEGQDPDSLQQQLEPLQDLQLGSTGAGEDVPNDAAVAGAPAQALVAAPATVEDDTRVADSWASSPAPPSSPQSVPNTAPQTPPATTATTEHPGEEQRKEGESGDQYPDNQTLKNDELPVDGEPPVNDQLPDSNQPPGSTMGNPEPGAKAGIPARAIASYPSASSSSAAGSSSSRTAPSSTGVSKTPPSFSVSPQKKTPDVSKQSPSASKLSAKGGGGQQAAPVSLTSQSSSRQQPAAARGVKPAAAATSQAAVRQQHQPQQQMQLKLPPTTQQQQQTQQQQTQQTQQQQLQQQQQQQKPPQQPRMVDCAVSLQFLIEFCAGVPEDMPTWKVVTDIIVPRTRERQCRYVEVIEPRYVGPCDYFISHRWATPFSHLVRYVRKHLVELGDVVESDCSGDSSSAAAPPPGVVLTKAKSKGRNAPGAGGGAAAGAGDGDEDEEATPKRSADKVFVWCDIFAINQHPGQVQADDLAQLKDCVEASHQTLLCLDDKGLVLTRIWCLYEIWNTILAGGPPKLAVLGYDVNQDAFKEVYITLDVAEAQATVDADRVRILADIAASTGLEHLNQVLKRSLVESTEAEAENALKALNKHLQMLTALGRHQEAQRYGYILQTVNNTFQRAQAASTAAQEARRTAARGRSSSEGTAPPSSTAATAPADAGSRGSAEPLPVWHWSHRPREASLRQVINKAASAERHGHYDTAMSLYRDAVVKAKQQAPKAAGGGGGGGGGVSSLDLAGCLLHLGTFLSSRGFLEQVAMLAKNHWQSNDLRSRLLDEAYGIRESQLGPTHEATLDTLREKAEVGRRGSSELQTWSMVLAKQVTMVEAYERCLLLDLSVPGVAKMAAKMLAERDGSAGGGAAAASTAAVASTAAPATTAAAASPPPPVYDGPSYMQLVQDMSSKWGALDLAGAEPICRQIVECQAAAHGAISKEVVDARVQLARLLQSAQGRLEDAVAEMRGALAVHEKLLHGKDPTMSHTLQAVYGPDHFEVGAALMQMAGLIMNDYERLEEGQEMMQRGLAIHQKFQQQQAALAKAF